MPPGSLDWTMVRWNHTVAAINIYILEFIYFLRRYCTIFRGAQYFVILDYLTTCVSINGKLSYCMSLRNFHTEFYLNIFATSKAWVIIFKSKVFENFIVQNTILPKNCALLNEWVDGWMASFSLLG